jgi:hypothetical protein
VPGKSTAHPGVEWCGGCEGESSVLRFGSAERRPKWQKLGWKSLDGRPQSVFLTKWPVPSSVSTMPRNLADYRDAG